MDQSLEQAWAAALGILRPPGMMVQQPLGDGGTRGHHYHITRLLRKHRDCQKSARVCVTHPVKSSLYLLSYEGLETYAKTS